MCGALALVALGCSSEGSDEPAALRELGAATALPECPAFDYSPCDISSGACQSKLLEIARCLRGGDTAQAVAPPFRVISEADARAAYLEQAGTDVEPSLRHFARALGLFGLTLPSSFEPQPAADRYATQTAGYYDNEAKAITLIEHDEPYDELNGSTILLHELIHALQDAEHDFASFWQTYEQSVDNSFALASLIEGEARLQERRVFAAMLGLDMASLDFARSFDNAREYTEEWLFAQSELYFSSRLSIPYSHGSDFLYGVFAERGAAGVRSLFDSPPLFMHDVLSALWARPGDVEPRVLGAPEVPEAEDASVQFSSSLGSWMLYLLLHPRTNEAEARRLALGWRGDQLTALVNSIDQTTAHWQLELADEATASRIEALITQSSGEVRARRDGTALTLVRSYGDVPSWLTP
jgi:hypothetical protein